jgi:hypothetical protein
MPLEGFNFTRSIPSLNTLSANFSYTEGNESSYITGTQKDIYSKIWPEMLIGISGVERLFGTLKWMTDSQVNFKYHNKTATTYHVSYDDSIMYGFDYRLKFLRMVDLYFAIENTNSDKLQYDTLRTLGNGLSKKYVGQGAFSFGKWRFSLRYENEEQWQKNNSSKYALNVYKKSYLGQINSDMIFPSGIKFPIVKTVLPLKNRIIFLSNFKYIDKQSGINVEKDNNINYGASANADYEISKYFRFLIGIVFDRFEYKYNTNLNYYDFSLISKLTIQF